MKGIDIELASAFLEKCHSPQEVMASAAELGFPITQEMAIALFNKEYQMDSAIEEYELNGCNNAFDEEGKQFLVDDPQKEHECLNCHNHTVMDVVSKIHPDLQHYDYGVVLRCPICKACQYHAFNSTNGNTRWSKM